VSKEKQLAKNTLIVGLSKISSVLAVFLVLPIYTKYLTAEQYGFFDLVTVYGALIAPVIMLRLEVAIFRWLVDARKKADEIANIIANIFQIILVCLTVFTAIYWLVALLVDLQYAGLIYGYLVFFVLSSVTLQVSRGLGRIKEFAFGGIIAGVSSLAIGAALILLFDMRLDGVLWGLMLGYGVAFLYNALAMRLDRHIVKGVRDGLLKSDLIRFSLPMIPNGMSGWATFAGTKVIVSSILGMAANGIYAVSSRFTTLFSGVYEIFNTTWTESASLHIKAPDRDQYFTKIFNMANTFFGSAAIVFIAALPLIFPLFVDDSFADAYWYVPVMVAGFFFDTITRMIGAVYVALRLTKQVMYITVTGATISITGAIILTPFMGLWGAIVASAGTLALMAMVRYIDIRRRGVGIKLDGDRMIILLVGYSVVMGVYYLAPSGFSLHIVTTLCAAAFAVYMNRRVLARGIGMLIRKRQREDPEVR
jgi:O-antigen/teichoic acid export membrane protein